jgi:hypothetical protein
MYATAPDVGYLMINIVSFSALLFLMIVLMRRHSELLALKALTE